MYRPRPSTTRARQVANVQPGRRGQKRGAGVAGIRSAVQPAAARTPVTVTIQFMPGSEPWVRITRDGAILSIPGRIEVWELCLLLNGWSST